MTNEEILDLIKSEGEAKFIAAMRFLGYYVQLQATDPVVDPSLLVKGKIRLVDANGYPQTGIGVIVETPSQNLRIMSNSKLYNVGFSKATKVHEINASGEASIALIKGCRVKVHVENTYVSREFIVPDEDFNILDIESIAPDSYTTIIPPTTRLIRSDV
jgi:hypothetical protein